MRHERVRPRRGLPGMKNTTSDAETRPKFGSGEVIRICHPSTPSSKKTKNRKFAGLTAVAIGRSRLCTKELKLKARTMIRPASDLALDRPTATFYCLETSRLAVGGVRGLTQTSDPTLVQGRAGAPPHGGIPKSKCRLIGSAPPTPLGTRRARRLTIVHHPPPPYRLGTANMSREPHLLSPTVMVTQKTSLRLWPQVTIL